MKWDDIQIFLAITRTGSLSGAAEVLGVPADVTQTVLLPVGYMKGAGVREANRQGWREVTFWDEWGRSVD